MFYQGEKAFKMEKENQDSSMTIDEAKEFTCAKSSNGSLLTFVRSVYGVSNRFS